MTWVTLKDVDKINLYQTTARVQIHASPSVQADDFS